MRSTGRAGGSRVPVLAWVVAAALTLAVGVAAGVVVAARTAGVSTLEPTGTAGAHPFVTSAGADVAALGGAPAVGEVDGDLPGLFLDAGPGVCDPARTAAVLTADAVRAGAWADVAGVEEAGIPAYLDGLTPLVLGSDTAVTEHDFREGRAVSYGAVLQRGTAVLVSDRGAPAVKCVSGNPLTAPEAGVPSAYAGPGWPGFAGTTTIAESSAPVAAFGVVDSVTGQRGSRPARGSGGVEASRPGATWGADPVEVSQSYVRQPLDLGGYFSDRKDRCAAESTQCIGFEYTYWDGKQWVKADPDDPALFAECNGVAAECRYLHAITYTPPPVMVDANGQPMRVKGEYVTCSPPAAGCRLQPGTKATVQFSAPIGFAAAEERATIEPGDLEPGETVNPGSGAPIVVSTTLAPHGPNAPGGAGIAPPVVAPALPIETLPVAPPGVVDPVDPVVPEVPVDDGEARNGGGGNGGGGNGDGGNGDGGNGDGGEPGGGSGAGDGGGAGGTGGGGDEDGG